MLRNLHSIDQLEQKQQPEQSTLPYGAARHGGYFSGVFQCEGKSYSLIVSPKTLGEFKAQHWGAYCQRTTATSFADGHNNTRIMAAAGYKAAKQALRLDINNFNDWYIPSRDELELMYRHLKPSTQSNLMSFRDGENPSSIPPGFPYCLQSPTQSTAQTFQLGQSECMDKEDYWSSTEATDYSAWNQHFGYGYQSTNHKNAKCKIRVVRKVAL